MASVTVSPICKVGSPGRRARFLVRVEGDDACTIAVRPSSEAIGYSADLGLGGDSAPVTPEGVVLSITAPPGAGMA